MLGHPGAASPPGEEHKTLQDTARNDRQCRKQVPAIFCAVPFLLLHRWSWTTNDVPLLLAKTGHET
eukprot:2113521-Alexandrium_andersonii.AAC.1